jgi:hypothetical protein
MKLKIKASSTNRIARIFVQDSTSTTSGGLTGLLYNSSGLKWEWSREGDADATAVTLVTATAGMYANGGFVAVSSTSKMPGAYEIGLPAAAIASGAKTVHMELYGATNMVPVLIEIELDAVDYQDGVRAGLTALPNVTAGASGGLPLGDANARVDLGKVLGTASQGAAGYVGIDWGHVNAPTTTVALSGTTVGTLTANADKTGYSLTVAPPTAAQTATAVWQDATAGDFTAAGSVGKGLFLSGNAPATVGGLLTRGAGPGQVTTDGAGNVAANVLKWAGGAVTLDADLPAVSADAIAGDSDASTALAANVANLDATVSSRSTAQETAREAYGVSGTVWHVSTAGNDSTGDGLSWATAYATLTEAASVMAAGDMIRLGAGVFAITAGIAPAAHSAIVGQGIDTTTISSAVDGTPLIQLVDGLLVQDLTILSTADSTHTCFPIGCNFTAFNGAVLRRVKTVCFSDGLYMHPTGACSFNAYDCLFVSQDDAVNIDAGSNSVTADFYDCTLVSVGLSSQTYVTRGIRHSGTGTVRVIRGSIRMQSVSGSSGNTYAAFNDDSTGGLHLIGTKLHAATAGSGTAYHLASNTTALYVFDVDYDPARVLLTSGGMVAVQNTPVNQAGQVAAGAVADLTTLLSRVPGTVQPQTGDAYARLGAAGAGLTALGDARIAHLDADVSSRSTFATGGDVNVANYSGAPAPDLATAISQIGAIAEGSGGVVLAGLTTLDSHTLSTLTQTQVSGYAGPILTDNGTGLVTANVAKLAGQTVTAASGVTFPASVGTSTYAGGAVASVTGTVGSVTAPVTLASAYDAAKTAAQAGDAMALTSGERTTLASVFWDVLTSATRAVGSYGAKLKAWVLGSDSKALLSADAQTGVTIPTVTTLTDAPDDSPTAAKLAMTLQGTGPYAFTAAALANAPTGSSGGGGTVTGYANGQDPATLVLDALAFSHDDVGSIGQKINAAGGSADPLTNPVPGGYAPGTAGYVIGTATSDVAGPGASRVTLKFYSDPPTDSVPIVGASVWVTTDPGGRDVVAGTITTDSLGSVLFLLTAGATYYAWMRKDGMNPVLGKPFTAVADA